MLCFALMTTEAYVADLADLADPVARVISALPPEARERLAARPPSRFDAAASRAGSPPVQRRPEASLIARYRDDLIGLLNACRIDELVLVAQRLGPVRSIEPDPMYPGVAGGATARLRLALWHALIDSARPAPAVAPPNVIVIIIGSRLVACAAARGMSPPAECWPRSLPAPRVAEPPEDEPECVDSLLDAAGRALGVRLGARGGDGKGAWGQRAAALLGVIDRGDQEPDWRGDVEIKTVAVARARSGYWHVVEDPAISSVGAAPIAKLQRVLWLCRAEAEAGDATLLSWYLQDWDDLVASLVQRYLHTRPKGPRGSTSRGYYLHKRFFADAGLLASLNGPTRS